MKAAGAAVEDVCLELGTFALRNVELTVAPGEILVILGPNGAGKSITLETIAGFHRLRSGRIIIGGRDVTGLPPERRGVGLVFQNYGLFPHLTVAANVAFGLRGRSTSAGLPGGTDVAGLLARFGIKHLADRRPEDLSPGEKQRTALARALALQPGLFMFDEPFAALDARTRDSLREELGVFLREAGIPAIFVTHDQTDASVLADRVAIMDHGVIVQAGKVADVFRAPANSFVADFVGIENRLPGRVVGRVGKFWHIAIGESLLTVQGGSEADARGNGQASEVFLCIRGEDVILSAGGAANGHAKLNGAPVNRLSARVVRMTDLGALCKVVLDGGFPLTACVTRRGARQLGLEPGGDAVVEIEPDSIHMLAVS